MKRSAKDSYVISLMDLAAELKKIDEKGEDAIKEGFAERFGSILSISNEKCPKERPYLKEIAKLCKKLVKKGVFSSLFW